MRRMEWLGVFAVMGAMGLVACAPEEERPPAEAPAAPPPAEAPAVAPPPTGAVPEGATAEMVAQGQQLFTGQGNCFTCHGMDGKGSQLAPNLTDSEWLWLDPARGDMLTQAATLIETGVAQPKQYPAPMPAMGGVSLTPDQVRAVAAYAVSLAPAS